MPIELDNVTFRYGPQTPLVIDGMSFTVPHGQMLALMGPSGSGKSTLLQLIGGILRPTSGQINNSIPSHETTWVFQTPTLLNAQTVRHNIDIALYATGWSPKQQHARVETVIESVGLHGLGETGVSTLSGGQQQRVQIARALAAQPQLVLADEPTGQLDHTTTALVMDALIAARDAGTGIIIVTHDRYVAERCERIITLEDGHILSDEHRAEGSPT
ncbi:ABC transporter ATP-binding protein [Bifidobacterium oedipodis]|uniref:ABC transporter-like protein n=1 Tax=Bifidobacterium oedipodis TaxID=2675322 RepID=A0A7Y0EPY7_9BIFI|nr:ABC transporter ATP-binding protein [Bifidobacterium sp. DSM 109957]NMM94224.1 ABC transporter-like protein [Bifidobacterium sp. DSM 109957]